MKHIITAIFAVVASLCLCVPNAAASHNGRCLVDVKVECDRDCDPMRLTAVVLKTEVLDASGGGGGACPKLQQAVTIALERPVLASDGERLRIERTTWGSFNGNGVSWKHVGPSPESVGGCATARADDASWVFASLLLFAVGVRRRS